MALSEAVEDSFGPCFQVREHTVDPVEDLVCLLAADDLRLVSVCRRINVTEPAVRDDVCAGFHDLTNEPVPLRANKSETFDWLKFRLEGEGDRTHGNAFTDAAFTGYRI